MLFSRKTFPRLVSGEIELKTVKMESRDYFFDIVDTIAKEEMFDKFFGFTLLSMVMS